MDLWNHLLGTGLKPEELGIGQAAARAALLYIVTLFLVRLGKKRFLGRGTAFDVIVGIVVGSVAGRAITGNAQLGTAIAAVAVLMALHWLFSAVALHSHAFGVLVKGRSKLLIRDGEIDERALAREHLTHDDLEEDLRGKGKSSAAGIAEGRIERNGALSVIERKEPQVVEIKVEDGVQTVRLIVG